MRLFVAAELSEGLRDMLSETSARLRDQVRGRYVAPDSFHITLAFLGDVSDARVPDVCAALDEACAGQPPIRVTFGAFGSFGRRQRATLWQGFAQGVDELGGLAGDIRESLVDHGLLYDPAAFVPHVTLMRAADLSAGMLPMPIDASGWIEQVTLFRSDLSGPRPVYEPLYTLVLETEQDPEEGEY